MAKKKYQKTSTPPNPKTTGTSTRQSWKTTFQDKLPILKYVGGFILLLSIFYSIYVSDIFKIGFLNPFVSFQAKLSSFLLNLMGQNTTTAGTQLIGTTSLNVTKGCDGMEVTALYLIGVLLMPFAWRSKMWGVLTGLGVLFLLNLGRIVALYLSQIYWPSAFDFLHLHGGFALFTVVAIFMWARWANWAIRQER